MECGQNMKIVQVVLKACCRIFQSEFQFLHLIIIMHSIDSATGAHLLRNYMTGFNSYMLYECIIKQSLDT